MTAKPDKIPALMIAGTASGVGKTTVAMGIMAALSKERTVQPYKVGPDYIDPAFHTYITGRKCRNLDSYMLEAPMVRYLYEKNLADAEVAVVEGVMGLFDGAEVGSDIGTSAGIAKMLNLPVILVVDGAKVATSLAATVKGFDLFDPALRIAGVIINNVGSEAHYDLLKRGIEHHTDVAVCGYLKKDSRLVLPERHLGLVPAGEQKDLTAVFDALGTAVAETVDLAKLLELAQVKAIEMKAKAINIEETKTKEARAEEASVFRPKAFNDVPVRIGIALDEAFNFYYQDALDYMAEFGQVEWVPFSPMKDKKLPENLDGLYIGGGFPEMFPDSLKANDSFIRDLLEKLATGIPYTAECGGLMYLCDSLTDLEGVTHPMVGWFQGGTTMTRRLQHFGYAKLTLIAPGIFGHSGSINVHEFHRSKAAVAAPTGYHLEKIRGGQAIRDWSGGYTKGGGVAAYAHMHFMSNPVFAHNFVNACISFQKGIRDELREETHGH